MSQYIVTIIPVDGDGDAGTGPAAETVVRIETGAGRPTVKELTVRAPESSGLSGALPYVDFDLLLRAFVEPTEGRGRRRGATRTASGSAPGKAPAAPGKAQGAAGRARGAAVKAPARRPARSDALTAGRAYRKAPDPGELEAVYAQVGTISGVAAHFDVPVHTAQGWISRLRRRNAELDAA